MEIQTEVLQVCWLGWCCGGGGCYGLLWLGVISVILCDTRFSCVCRHTRIHFAFKCRLYSVAFVVLLFFLGPVAKGLVGTG